MKIRRLGALLGAAALVLGVAGVALADTPTVDSVGVPVVGTTGLDVTITFMPAWPACSGAPGDTENKHIGYAVAWGDVDPASTNTIDGATATYDFGAGTAVTADFDTPNCTDPLVAITASHTYTADGTYSICPVLYNVKPPPPDTAVGDYSLVAGGTDPAHNSINSVEFPPGQLSDATCVSVDVEAIVVGPTETPGDSSTAMPASNDNGTLPMVLLLLGATAAIVLVWPLSRRTR